MKLALVDDDGLCEVVIKDIEAAMDHLKGYESVYSFANIGVAVLRKVRKIQDGRSDNPTSIR